MNNRQNLITRTFFAKLNHKIQSLLQNDPSIIIISLVALLFFVKALIFAFQITPLWDIPDETGHFAYVRDIAEGKGLPVMGDALIGNDIIQNLRGSIDHRVQINWIAQHPPIYYLLAAIPLKIGSIFTNNPEVLYRLPRIVSALSGAFSLFFLSLSLRTIGLNLISTLAITVSMGSIPMFTNLSSGTNHDTTLFFFCTLSVYFLVKYLYQNKSDPNLLYYCAFTLSLAATTKITALVLLVSIVGLIFLEIPNNNFQEKSIIGLKTLVIAFFFPSLWLLRNFIVYKNPLYDADDYRQALNNLSGKESTSFIDYLLNNPVLEGLINHFIGLFGWQKSAGRWLILSGIPSHIFHGVILILFLCICCFLTCSLINLFLSLSNTKFSNDNSIENRLTIQEIKINKYIFISFSAFLSIMLFNQTIYDYDHKYYTIAAIVISLILSSIFSVILLLFSKKLDVKIVAYGCLIFCAFTFILLKSLYGIYIDRDAMQAIHGRYFYPVVPIMLLSFGIAIKSLPIPSWLLRLFGYTLVYAELYSFSSQVIPFYNY